MPPVFPRRLSPGGHVRVIAPARSLALITLDVRAIADARLAALGLTVSFGTHIEECDAFVSSSVESRVRDLHDAFADPSVDAILTVIGGFNTNQLLRSIDWELIAGNPKIFCGYSDITALSCAMHARTGLVTYSGPHYSTFGMEQHFEQTLTWFTECLMADGPMRVTAASTWSDDQWFLDQRDRTIEASAGPRVVNPGRASGRLIGGNLCTLNLLQGTEFMPSLDGALLFLEDDAESQPHTFDRNLTSLIQQPGFENVTGVLIGRFQRASNMTPELLARIVASKAELNGIPVVANLDFGHTDPLLTLPVGGHATFAAPAVDATVEFVIDAH